jgi:putative ABC transport system ATP-binding protein
MVARATDLTKVYGEGENLVTALDRVCVAVARAVAASYADRVVFLADGRIVGEQVKPTAETVLDSMRHLAADPPLPTED